MPTSVEYAGADLLVQLRDPPAIARASDKTSLTLPTDGLRDVEDTGFDLFHLSPDRVVACASCHPEGQEDGRAWDFADVGLRRTQSLRGGITPTAPFHWDGKMPDLRAIMTEVFTHRMGGNEQSEAHVEAISRWIDALPALPPFPRPRSKAAAVRGTAIFHDPSVGCASCHSGPSFTSNTNASVGKAGPPLQTPSLLGVAWRAPFMHDGCAKTLADRFDPACGGDQHGNVSALSDADLAALVAYLETL